MNRLSTILLVKIVSTLLFWCTPLLLFPSDWWFALGLPPQEHFLFPRLLGMAYLALCVGYAYGLQDARRGRKPIWCIAMGIVSNGGACLTLLLLGWQGTWITWGKILGAAMWLSVVSTGAIALSLASTLKKRA